MLRGRADRLGGGLHTAELTLPGFVHDVCSTIHAARRSASPFFRTLDLRHGSSGSHPPAPLAHPLDDGTRGRARALASTETAAGLGADAAGLPAAGRRRSSRGRDELVAGAARAARRRPARIRSALRARSALRGAAGSAPALARRARSRPSGRARCSPGIAAHSMLPLERRPSAGVRARRSRVLGHAVGWPFARGGSQRLADALVGAPARARRRDRDRSRVGRSTSCRRPASCCST